MIRHWQQLLQQRYGLNARLQQLGGERDLNFLAKTDAGDFIFKVMHQGCDSALVDMQCAALQHLRDAAPDLPLPEVIKTREDQQFITAKDQTGAPRLVWLQNRLNGECYADFSGKTPELAGKIGGMLARMDAELAGFTHPCLQREFRWSLPHGLWIKPHITDGFTPQRRALLAQITAEFERVLPPLNRLPSVAIHNDLNDYNILVTSTAKGAQVSGLIDFGDMTASPRICDLAIAGAYLVLGQTQPKQMLDSIVAAYHRQTPLTEAERALLWPLLRMRLAVSVVNSTREALKNPQDPYQTISQRPAWAFLESDIAQANPLEY